MATNGTGGNERKKRPARPPKKRMTKEELAARPAPKKPPKRTRSQAMKRAARMRKRAIPEAQKIAAKERMARINKKREDEKRIQVTLRTFHIFGTERYGPGTCWVPQCLVLAALEQDRRAVEAETQLFQERGFIITPGRNGVSASGVQVAVPNFMSLWAGDSPPIFDRISGKGMVDAGQGLRF